MNYHRLDEADGHGPFVLPYREVETQVNLLRQAGLNVVPADALDHPANPARPSLMITVDDGYKTDLQLADLFQRNGFSAIFFISTDKTGQPGYLDRNDLATLQKMGMKIGSHSHRHIGLTRLSLQEAEHELRQSKKLLESWLGGTVDHLAFPGGLYNAKLVKLARDAGYRVLMTTEWGSNRVDPAAACHVLKRTNVTRGMTEQGFLALARLKNDRSRTVVYQMRNAAHSILPNTAYSALRSWLNRVTH